jgi:hypothetical protein
MLNIMFFQIKTLYFEQKTLNFMYLHYFQQKYFELSEGANPTIVSFNVSDVKITMCSSSLVCLENNFSTYIEKTL